MQKISYIIKYDCLSFNCKISSFQLITINNQSYQNFIKKIKLKLALDIPNFKCFVLICSDIKTQEICDNTGEYVWNNNAICKVFSGCGSYQVDKKEDCFLKSTQTKFPTYDEEQQTNGKYNCNNDLSKSGGNDLFYSQQLGSLQYELLYVLGEPSQNVKMKQMMNSIYVKNINIAQEKKARIVLIFPVSKINVIREFTIVNGSLIILLVWRENVLIILSKLIVKAYTLMIEKGLNLVHGNKDNVFKDLIQLNKQNCLIDSLNISTWNEVEQKCQILSILINTQFQCFRIVIIIMNQSSDLLLLAKQRLNQKKVNKTQDIFCTQIKQKQQTIPDEEVEIDPISYEDFDDLKQLRRMIRQTDRSINQYGKEVKQLQNDIKKLTK